MSFSVLILNAHGQNESMKDIQFGVILPGPDVFESDDKLGDSEDNDDSEGRDPDDVPYYEEPICLDDHYQLIQHEYLANSVNGIQRLISMKMSEHRCSSGIIFIKYSFFISRPKC